MSFHRKKRKDIVEFIDNTPKKSQIDKMTLLTDKKHIGSLKM